MDLEVITMNGYPTLLRSSVRKPHHPMKLKDILRTPLFLKRGSYLSTGRRRVLLPHPGSATGHLIAPGDHHTLQHIQVHFGVDFQADFEDMRWHDVALTWNGTKDHNCSRKLCFHHPGHVESSGFAFWGCWQWSCCQLRAWVVQRCISDLARWTLCHFQTW